MNTQPLTITQPLEPLTPDVVLAQLRQLDPTRTNPVVDEGCVYNDGHGNRCLVGEWLHTFHDVDTTQLDGALDGVNSPSIISLYEGGHAMRAHLPHLDTVALELLRDAQMTADNWGNGGVPWGDAIQDAWETVTDPEAVDYCGRD